MVTMTTLEPVMSLAVELIIMTPQMKEIRFKGQTSTCVNVIVSGNTVKQTESSGFSQARVVAQRHNIQLSGHCSCLVPAIIKLIKWRFIG